MKNFLVIGLGEFGKSVAKTLYRNKATVLVIDARENLIKQALNEGIIEEAIILDATDEIALKKVVRDDFDTAFVSVGDNIQASILITLQLKELGVKLELSSMSFDNVLSSLKTGKADIAISGLSYTKERAQAYDFSEAYYKTENAILIKKSDLNKYTMISSFNNKTKVAVQKGTIEEGLAKNQLKQSNITSLTSMGEAVNELKSGQVDAIDLEKPVAEGYVSQNSDLVLAKVALKTGEGDAKAVALPKDSGQLVKTVNKVIKKLKKEDKYKQFISDAVKLTGQQVD